MAFFSLFALFFQIQKDDKKKSKIKMTEEFINEYQRLEILENSVCSQEISVAKLWFMENDFFVVQSVENQLKNEFTFVALILNLTFFNILNFCLCKEKNMVTQFLSWVYHTFFDWVCQKQNFPTIRVFVLRKIIFFSNSAKKGSGSLIINLHWTGPTNKISGFVSFSLSVLMFYHHFGQFTSQM